MWKPKRARPSMTEKRIPAFRSRSISVRLASSETIAESDSPSPTPERNRLARPTSWSWMVSMPTDSSSSRAGAVPTQLCQAGEMSKARAPSPCRSGIPYVASSAANHPAAVGLSRRAKAAFLFPTPGFIVRKAVPRDERSEEHTSELQSRGHLVCRLLLEKKKEEQSRDLHIHA